MKLSDKAEEILEALWIAVEEEGKGFAEIDGIGIPAGDPAYQELTSQTLVEVKEGRVYFRPEGKVEGRRTIRRHRLAERLLMDVLNVRGEAGDDKAASSSICSTKGRCQGLHHAQPSHHLSPRQTHSAGGVLRGSEKKW
nr:iron dependent repressor, metal binding and dimerization domain protein [Geotalea toluenoxydans]